MLTIVALVCVCVGLSEEAEGQANRKVSLQRYREKRNERYFEETIHKYLGVISKRSGGY